MGTQIRSWTIRFLNQFQQHDFGPSTIAMQTDRIVPSVRVEVRTFLVHLLDAPHQSILSLRLPLGLTMVLTGTTLVRSMDGHYHMKWSLTVKVIQPIQTGLI